MARLDEELLNYKSPYILNNDEKLLANKLEIQDAKELEKAERMITNYKLSKLYLNPGTQTFDVQHYLYIHKFLFEDIYLFAGEIRTEEIQKRIPFCLSQYIIPELKKTLENALRKSKKIQTREELLNFLVELYADLDIIHPFREVNGRTEREFIRQFIDFICLENNLESYYLDYNAIENREMFVDAVVKADAFLDYNELRYLFDSILKSKRDLELENSEMHR